MSKDKVKYEIDNCLDCPHHLDGIDCTTEDEFCYDDHIVVCELANDKEITTQCRPYNLRKECRIPDWCPLIKEEKNEIK